MSDKQVVAGASLPRFVAGVLRFRAEAYPPLREHFARLACGQTPEALFVTCSDSRIDPALLTGSSPGQLFVARNPGNIVPPWPHADGGVAATVEYAVGVLRVPHVVICGHSGCGAMRALTLPGETEGFPALQAWLGHASAVGSTTDEDPQLAAMAEQNVRIQLEHLRSHPEVAAALEAGHVCLHGWVYDIASGEVSALDEAGTDFVPVEKAYAEC